MMQLFHAVLGLLVIAAAAAAHAGGPAVSELDDAALVELMAPSDELQGRCGTPVALEMLARGLSVETSAVAVDTFYHETDGGHFRVAYQVEGALAVDTTDLDLSGVPDYVELVGSSFERSWYVEIDSLGFPTVELGIGERYQVSTVYGVGFFGVTEPNASAPGGSMIKIHHDIGALDPGAPEVELLLATVAHEFKHAVQIASGWDIIGVGGWIELDATWIEDLVFDDSNDYYRYLSIGGTPFTAPDQSLAATPLYQDCTWQHYLGETFGHEFMLDFSERVALGRPGQLAYVDVANQRALDWLQLWRGYTIATYLGGERAVAGIGFSEGEFYPEAVVRDVSALPYGPVVEDNVADMAMRYHVFDSAAAATTGRLQVKFAGTVGRAWSLVLIYQRADDTQVVEIPVVDSAAQYVSPLLVEDYDTVGVLVGNPRVPSGPVGSAPYSLELVRRDPLDAAPATMGRFKGRFRPRSDQ